MLKLIHYFTSRQIVVFKGEFWYFSHDLSAEEGIIRSISEGDVSVPQQGWQQYDKIYMDVKNFHTCRTEGFVFFRVIPMKYV